MRRLFRWIKRWIQRLILLTLLVIAAAGGYLLHEGYQMYEEALAETPVQQVIESIQAKPSYTPLEQIPLLYQNAVVAAEDHRFYKHNGLDYIAIGRATVHGVAKSQTRLSDFTFISPQFFKTFTNSSEALKFPPVLLMP